MYFYLFENCWMSLGWIVWFCVIYSTIKSPQGRVESRFPNCPNCEARFWKSLWYFELKILTFKTRKCIKCLTYILTIKYKVIKSLINSKFGMLLFMHCWKQHVIYILTHLHPLQNQLHLYLFILHCNSRCFEENYRSQALAEILRLHLPVPTINNTSNLASTPLPQPLTKGYERFSAQTSEFWYLQDLRVWHWKDGAISERKFLHWVMYTHQTTLIPQGI